MIAIIGAMDIELKPLLKKIEVREKIEKEKYYFIRGVYKDKEIVLVKTGIGIKKAAKVLIECLNKYDIKTSICLGTAGGVKEELKAGDNVLPALIFLEGSNKIHSPDKALMSLAKQCLSRNRTRIYCGVKLLTVTKVFYQEDKQVLNRNEQKVFAVDMEAFAWSEVLTNKNIPFIIVKAIADEYSFVFPRNLSLIKEWYSVKNIIILLQKSLPTKIGDIFQVIRFRINWKKAVKSNTELVEKLLEVM